jgi:hypothetical protein
LFSAKEVDNTWQSGLSASPEFKAWLARVRSMIKSDTIEKNKE